MKDLMIAPVLFPFTWLDEKTAGLILSCFERIRVYIPTKSAGRELPQDFLNKGAVEACHPFPDDGREVDKLFRDYRQWRQATRGTDISFFKTANGGAPFFNENTVSFLRQDILRAVPGAAGKAVDQLSAARVFLRLTGDYDRARAEIAEDLSVQQQKEFSMLEALHGGDGDRDDDEDSAVPANTNPISDDSELMIPERLTAWSLLAAATDPLSAVFVTSSRAVLAYVRGLFGNNEPVRDNVPVPSVCRQREQPAGGQWRDDLEGFIDGLLRGGDAGRADKSALPAGAVDKAVAFLTIISLADVSPRYFLEKFHKAAPCKRNIRGENGPVSTVVAAVIPA